MRLFADDTIIYITINANDSNSLQDDLCKLECWEKKWLMSFHPNKCEVMTITNKKTPLLINYYLHGQCLKRTSKAKYLGVTISSTLSWKDHINAISSKANSTLGFLRRNLSIESRSIKERAYFALVRPQLEYCATVWDPQDSGSIKKLEMVQRRAARYVLGRYRRRASVTEMLSELQWSTLKERRLTSKLGMMYKINNDLVALTTEDLQMEHLNRPGRHSNSYAFKIPYAKRDAYKNSFVPTTIRAWNNLPNSIAGSPSLDTFKAGLSSA